MVKVHEVKIRTGTRPTDGWKWPKNLRWRRRGRYYVTGARRQELEAAERFGCIRFITAGRLRSDSIWLIMNISNRSRDHAWWRDGTTDVTNARTCHFFAACLTVFLEFGPQTFTMDSMEKKIYQIRAYDFGVQFPFNVAESMSTCICTDIIYYVHSSVHKLTVDFVPTCHSKQ